MENAAVFDTHTHPDSSKNVAAETPWCILNYLWFKRELIEMRSLPLFLINAGYSIVTLNVGEKELHLPRREVVYTLLRMRDVSILIIAFSGLFAAVTLARPHKTQADFYLLAMLVLLNAFPVRFFVLSESSGLTLSYITQGSLLVFGPVFLIYNLAYTDDNFRLRPSFLLLAPPAACYAALFLLEDPPVLRGDAYIALSFVISVLLVAFQLVSLIVVTRRRSRTRSERVTWLLGVNVGILVVWTISGVQDGLLLTEGPISFGESYQDLTPWMILVLLAFLGVLGARSGVMQVAARRGPSAPRTADARIMDRVIASMTSEELFLKPELTFVDLSIHLGERPESVSLAITSSGFRDMVNRYRIDRFKSLVADGAANRFTIESVAL